jgi:hypothetical protein
MGKHHRYQALLVVFLLLIGCSWNKWAKPALTKTAGSSLPTDWAVARLINTLKTYGLDPVVEDTYNHITASMGLTLPHALWVGRPQNVIAIIPGTKSQGTILLWAHYQDRYSAGDHPERNGSASLLKLACALKALPPLPNDIVLLFSPAHSGAGTEGAGQVSYHSLARQPDVVLQITDAADLRQVNLFFASKYNYQLVRDFARVRQQLSPGQELPDQGTALAFIPYLANQPLDRYPEPPAPGASVLVMSQTGYFHPALKPVDEVVLNFMQRWEIPGGAVAIAKDGRLVYARAFGFAHQETKTAVLPWHQFRIASLSKPITAGNWWRRGNWTWRRLCSDPRGSYRILFMGP